MSTFKTHVDVRSDHFPITAIEMEKWEGQITSELLAQHLAEQFNQQQLEIAAIHNEDWGYQLSFSDSAYKDIFIEYNRYEQNDNLFLIFIHPPQPIIKKYFLRK